AAIAAATAAASLLLDASSAASASNSSSGAPAGSGSRTGSTPPLSASGSVSMMESTVGVPFEYEAVMKKRMRNTEAARRSRARKTAKLESLEDSVNRLEMENSKLSLRVSTLEGEKDEWTTKEKEYKEKIAKLEKQLKAEKVK
ncbi:hypothetical protein HDV05_002092, partial [Chytridiales sp. JEL 0842]